MRRRKNSDCFMHSHQVQNTWHLQIHNRDNCVTYMSLWPPGVIAQTRGGRDYDHIFNFNVLRDLNEDVSRNFPAFEDAVS